MKLRSLALALLLAATPASAQQPFFNPVLQFREGVADPHLLKWNGEYYLYATGDPIRAYHSKDLVHWDTIGAVISGSRAPTAWNQADVWAPEVVYRNGKFYLYYTASKASQDWRVGEMARRIGVGVSDSPRGPFVDAGYAVTPGWGIDGHVFKDPADGREYMFYSYLYEPRLPGAGIVADLMTAWDALSGKPSHVTRGSEAWEDKDGDPGNGSLRYTNEAPTVLKKNDRYYMMYSGGSWDLPSYSMAYAYSQTVLTGGLDGAGWTKVVPPILRSTPIVQGPGHNSVAKAPNNVDDVTAYHARTVPFVGPGDRQTFIDRLYWNYDRLFMMQPSTGALTPPDRPLFADVFDRAVLGPEWNVVSGSWQIINEQLRGSGQATLGAPPLAHYVLEANVRIPGKGAAGVTSYARNGARFDVYLDRERHAFLAGGRSVKLPADFRFDAYHQILATKNADRMRLTLDGVDMFELQVPAEAAHVALVTRSGSAEFDGVALTSHFEDSFEKPALNWSVESGTWLPDEGALHQVAGGAQRSVALKGDAAENYEFTANVRVRDNDATNAQVGVVAAAAGNALVTAGFDRTIWPYARFHVRFIQDGLVRNAIAVDMPRGFDYNAYHTIRVLKQAHSFTFYLDGDEIAAARFQIGTARPGLFTEGARAAFDDVAMKRLRVVHNLVLDGSFEAEASPWQLSAGALKSMCCAHTGVHRLLLNATNATATQEVDGLTPGRYSLVLFATTQSGVGEVRVMSGGRELASRTVANNAWQRLTLDFELTDGSGNVSVVITPKLNGNNAFVAIDDVYLYRN